MARDICAKEQRTTVRKEPARGYTSYGDFPVPGHTKHSYWVLCRAHSVWNLLWGRSISRRIVWLRWPKRLAGVRLHTASPQGAMPCGLCV